MTFSSFVDGMNAHLDRGSGLAEVKAYIATGHEHAEKIEAEQARLAADYAELKRIHSELEKKRVTRDGSLEPILEEVLKVVAGAKEVAASTVAKAINQPEHIAQAFLTKLAGKPYFYIMANIYEFSGEDITYSIMPPGSLYLFSQQGH